jgi:hypothetical protein
LRAEIERQTPAADGRHAAQFIKLTELKMRIARILAPLALAVLIGGNLYGGTAPSLKAVQKVYISPMPNDLDQYIRAEITKQLNGRIVVVLEAAEADAVMAGVADHKTGVGPAITGRWLGLHDNATGAISLVDKDGKVVMWSSEAGDRIIFWGALKRSGPRKVADRLVNNLKKAIEQE